MSPGPWEPPRPEHTKTTRGAADPDCRVSCVPVHSFHCLKEEIAAQPATHLARSRPISSPFIPSSYPRSRTLHVFPDGWLRIFWPPIALNQADETSHCSVLPVLHPAYHPSLCTRIEQGSRGGRGSQRMAPPASLGMSFRSADRALDNYQFTFEAFLDDSVRIEPDVCSSRPARAHGNSRLTIRSLASQVPTMSSMLSL